MRFPHLPMFLVLLFVPAMGCGGSSSPETVETSDLQAYINDNPEMAARQKEREKAVRDALAE